MIGIFSHHAIFARNWKPSHRSLPIEMLSVSPGLPETLHPSWYMLYSPTWKEPPLSALLQFLFYAVWMAPHIVLGERSNKMSAIWMSQVLQLCLKNICFY